MKNNKEKQNTKAKKGLKTPAIPVPPAATELSEEDLTRVTGGAPPGPSEFKIPPGPSQ